jgi:PAB1-binding protein PBP1
VKFSVKKKETEDRKMRRWTIKEKDDGEELM